MYVMGFNFHSVRLLILFQTDGSFIMKAVMYLVVFSSALCITTLVGGAPAKGRCSEETSLGEVLGVSYSPVVPKPSQPLEVTLRLRSTFITDGSWSLEEDVAKIVNRVVVREQDTGDVRSTSAMEKMPMKTFEHTFTLHLASYNPAVKMYFNAKFEHPCNFIGMYAWIESWKNQTGVPLPTVLHVPESLIDLRSTRQASTAVGIRFDTSVMINGGSFWFFNGQARNGVITPIDGSPNGYGSEESVSVDWQAVPGRGVAPQKSRSLIEGEFAFRKDPTKVKDTTAYFIVGLCRAYLNTSGEIDDRFLTRFTFRVDIQILVSDATKPAIGLFNNQHNGNFLNYSGEYYDGNGVRIIPMTRHPGLTMSPVFECFAAAVGNRPNIVTRVMDKPSDDVRMDRELPGLYPGVSRSEVAYQAYEASLAEEVTDYICSATSGGQVNSLTFKVLRTENVKVASGNPSRETLDEDTFKQGYRLTCRAEGSPKPIIKFFKQSSYTMGRPVFIRYLAVSGNTEEIKESDSDRFNIELGNDGESTLVISPGNSPFDDYGDDNKFRLVCLGINSYTANATYVDFISENPPEY